MSENAFSRFEYQCPRCRGRFTVKIQAEIHRLHKATCPHCENSIFFDNRNGNFQTGENNTEKEPEKKTQGLYASSGNFSNSAILKSEKRNLQISIPDYIRKRFSLKKIKARQKLILKLGVITGGLLAIFLVFFLSLLHTTFFLPKNPELYLSRLKGIQANIIYDQNEKVLAELFTKKTGTLNPDEIPVTLRDKLLFVEDKYFYEHNGIHYYSIIRAFVANLLKGAYSQGGSTITQQLARILLKDRTKTLNRKFKEAALSYYVESQMSKDEILTAYINQVYLGHGAIGMESAAQFYFEKELPELNFVEELILVSLPPAPEYYSPLRNIRILEKKLDSIYEKMTEDDFPVISRGEYEQEKLIVLQNMSRSPDESIFGSRTDFAPYVTEHIRLQLQKLFGQEYEFSAGFKIYTTIDKDLQIHASQKSLEHVQLLSHSVRPIRMINGKAVLNQDIGEQISREYESFHLASLLFGIPVMPKTLPGLQTASVGINPETGGILFLQGGVEFKSSNQLNRVSQMRRQTGSVIKPIVYSAALESGILNASSRLDDTPIFEKVEKKSTTDPDYWLPENISGVYEGPISMRRALSHSKNIPAIRTARLLGMDRLAKQFKKFFFHKPDDFKNRFRNDETIAIGSLELTPLEMASAYAAFASNGYLRRPYIIERIVDANGITIYKKNRQDEFQTGYPLSQKILPGDVAHVLSLLMNDAARRGGVPKWLFKTRDILGKTGTTNEYRDTWFAGAVPGLSVAVWIGYDDPAYSVYRATGASAAGPLFGKIIASFPSNVTNFQFSPRATEIMICPDSGLLSTPQCPKTESEFYSSANFPKENCNIHKEEDIDEKQNDQQIPDSEKINSPPSDFN